MVGASLSPHDPGLRRHVGFERAVTIQVVGLDVEHHGNMRAKAVHGFKLKAGKLEDIPCVIPSVGV